MVKDFKYIIKKILIGLGIAICLMYLKGGLLANVHALSCDTESRQYYKVLSSPFWGDIPNNTNGTGMNIVYYNHNANTDGRQKIQFNGADYIDVYVPVSFSQNVAFKNIYDSQGNVYQMDFEGAPPVFYLLDNTNNPNNNSWTQGVWENGSYRVRYYKKDYSQPYVNITIVKIGVPGVYYSNFNELFIWCNDYFQVFYYKCDSNQAITESINENTQAIDNVNNSINDSSTDDPGSDITSMNDRLATNGSITQLLTLPIRLYQNILNATTGSCSRFELGELLGHSLILPCINLQNTLGSSLWSIIDILISGIFILAFRKKMVDIFNNMTSLKDRGNELE